MGSSLVGCSQYKEALKYGSKAKVAVIAHKLKFTKDGLPIITSPNLLMSFEGNVDNYAKINETGGNKEKLFDYFVNNQESLVEYSQVEATKVPNIISTCTPAASWMSEKPAINVNKDANISDLSDLERYPLQKIISMFVGSDKSRKSIFPEAIFWALQLNGASIRCKNGNGYEYITIVFYKNSMWSKIAKIPMTLQEGEDTLTFEKAKDYAVYRVGNAVASVGGDFTAEKAMAKVVEALDVGHFINQAENEQLQETVAFFTQKMTENDWNIKQMSAYLVKYFEQFFLFQYAVKLGIGYETQPLTLN